VRRAQADKPFKQKALKQLIAERPFLSTAVPGGRHSSASNVHYVRVRRVLDRDDFHWTKLDGGYRTRFDPRPLLTRLESGLDPAATWHDLWDELHHQGDVGEASFAAVPHLVHIYRSRGVIDWNTYAIVAIIELARNIGQNPDVPVWLEKDYFRAIRELAETGAVEILRSEKPDTARAILSVLALERGLRTYAKFLVSYSEDELSSVESRL
jgi:hypothetical protein